MSAVSDTAPVPVPRPRSRKRVIGCEAELDRVLCAPPSRRQRTILSGLSHPAHSHHVWFTDPSTPQLPFDVWRELILPLLPPRDVGTLARTCGGLRRLVHEVLDATPVERVICAKGTTADEFLRSADGMKGKFVSSVLVEGKWHTLELNRVLDEMVPRVNCVEFSELGPPRNIRERGVVRDLSGCYQVSISNTCCTMVDDIVEAMGCGRSPRGRGCRHLVLRRSHLPSFVVNSHPMGGLVSIKIVDNKLEWSHLKRLGELPRCGALRSLELDGCKLKPFTSDQGKCVNLSILSDIPRLRLARLRFLTDVILVLPRSNSYRIVDCELFGHVDPAGFFKAFVKQLSRAGGRHTFVTNFDSSKGASVAHVVSGPGDRGRSLYATCASCPRPRWT